MPARLEGRVPVSALLLSARSSPKLLGLALDALKLSGIVPGTTEALLILRNAPNELSSSAVREQFGLS